MFVARWSACFIGAMSLTASQKRIALPPDFAVDAEMDLGMAGDGYFLQVRFIVSLPDVERDVAQTIRGNVGVTINLI